LKVVEVKQVERTPVPAPEQMFVWFWFFPLPSTGPDFVFFQFRAAFDFFLPIPENEYFFFKVSLEM